MSLEVDLLVISGFLARRDVADLDRLPQPAEVLVLMGSAVLESVEVAARAFDRGVVGRILASGGIGHSTRHLVEAVAAHERYSQVPTAGRPESHIFRDILQDHLGVDPAAITIEDRSTKDVSEIG